MHTLFFMTAFGSTPQSRKPRDLNANDTARGERGTVLQRGGERGLKSFRDYWERFERSIQAHAVGKGTQRVSGCINTCAACLWSALAHTPCSSSRALGKHLPGKAGTSQEKSQRRSLHRYHWVHNRRAQRATLHLYFVSFIDRLIFATAELISGRCYKSFATAADQAVSIIKADGWKLTACNRRAPFTLQPFQWAAWFAFM